jgi:polygalacturonase
MKYFKNRFGIYLLIIISLSACDLMMAVTKPYFNVIEYGASANGQTLDTKSIQKAIDECSDNGGGTVEFPAETYLTGTIYL